VDALVEQARFLEAAVLLQHVEDRAAASEYGEMLYRLWSAAEQLSIGEMKDRVAETERGRPDDGR
jgi:hypothetical protein